MKTLIISIGGTPEPVAHSIREHNPNFVLFFCSKQTAEDVPKVKELFEGNLPHYDKIITKNHEDVNACITALKEELPKFAGSLAQEVLVDITGGTKAMAAGLLFGTSGKGYSYSYIGGSKRDEQGRVLTEAMRLYEFKDPAAVFKDVEKRLMAHLFNIYRFDAIVETVTCLPVLPKEEYLFNGIKSLAEGYFAWERFEHKGAITKLSEGRRLIEIHSKYIQENVIETDKIIKNIEFLQILIESGNKGLQCVTDIFCNALRRIEEGKFDDAVARLYSCFERIGKIMLLNYGIDDSDVPESRIPEKLHDEFIKKYKDEDSKIKLPLAAKFRILAELDNEYGKLFFQKEQELKEIMAARNASILAHGTTPIKKESAEKFALFVGQFIPEDRIAFPKLKW